MKVINIACVASIAFWDEPNEISGHKKEFSHSGHVENWSFLLLPHFPHINSFSWPNVLFGLYWNASYAGSYKNYKKCFRLITLDSYILYLYYNSRVTKETSNEKVNIKVQTKIGQVS